MRVIWPHAHPSLIMPECTYTTPGIELYFSCVHVFIRALSSHALCACDTHAFHTKLKTHTDSMIFLMHRA